MEDEIISHHLKKLMALVEVRHDDTLSFRYRAIDTNKLAVLPHRVDLVQSELVLNYHVVSGSLSTSCVHEMGRGYAKEQKNRNMRIDTYRVQITRTEGPPVLEDLVEALLHCGELVRLENGRGYELYQQYMSWTYDRHQLFRYRLTRR